MATDYIEILAVGRPIHFDVDGNSRCLFSVNIEALVEGRTDTWVEDVISILNSAGLADAGVDTFIGYTSQLPDVSTPIITVIDTGGPAIIETHNEDIRERLTAQIIVRGDYQVSNARALAIWRELDGIRGLTV